MASSLKPSACDLAYCTASRLSPDSSCSDIILSLAAELINESGAGVKNFHFGLARLISGASGIASQSDRLIEASSVHKSLIWSYGFGAFFSSSKTFLIPASQ